MVIDNPITFLTEMLVAAITLKEEGAKAKWTPFYPLIKDIDEQIKFIEDIKIEFAHEDDQTNNGFVTYINGKIIANLNEINVLSIFAQQSSDKMRQVFKPVSIADHSIAFNSIPCLTTIIETAVHDEEILKEKYKKVNYENQKLMMLLEYYLM